MRPSTYNRTTEKLIISYLAFLAFFILVFRNLITGWFALFTAQVIAALIFLVIIRLQTSRPESSLLQTVRNWMPLPYILFGYKMIHYLINHDRNPGFMVIKDRWLIIADRFLFGTDPTVWLQRITVPWLTELMQIVYATNYFLPLILVLTLYLKKERIPFQKSVAVLTLGYILSYLGYFIIPAIGPAHTLRHYLALKGIFIRESLARWNYCLDACPRDCFPSGHTEIPLITLWLAYRFKRALSKIYLPIVILLIISTVYLRYHYVIDVIAGIALAGVVIMLSRKMEKRRD